GSQFVAARVRDKICKSLRQICIAAILRQPLQEIVMKLFERIEVYNDFTPRSAAMNMAIDEALLETANAASICFYRWLSPAISFSNPVRDDVKLNGRKIAGAAQRRTRRGLLHQGSIQDVELGSGLAERFAQALCAKCRERKIDNDVLKRACELAKQKYGTESW